MPWLRQLAVRQLPSARPRSPFVCGRTSSALVIQISLTVLLLVAGGLVVRSSINLQRVNLGFVPADVVTLNVTPRNAPAGVNQWMAEFLRRVEALPDVDAAGAVYLRPLGLGPIGEETGIILNGQPVERETTRQNPALNFESATPGYFRAMRIPLLEGRLFTDRDTDDAPPVALVSASTARRLWPGRSPIGQRFMLTHDKAPPERAWRTVGCSWLHGADWHRPCAGELTPCGVRCRPRRSRSRYSSRVLTCGRSLARV